MNTKKIDDLIKALDRAADSAENLRTALDAKDKVGIAMERNELAKALLAIDELARLINRELG